MVAAFSGPPENVMPTYVQANRPLTVSTPLGPDKLLMAGFTGREAISELFVFHVDLAAENRTDIPFDQLLGQKITVNQTLADGKTKRFFNGVCSRISQGERDDIFTAYRVELVPQFWLLTRRAQSRIFQHLTVPDILKKVLSSLDVTYAIQGSFEPREYCVQYRESDFNFASRLMEEEGIYYFFEHSATSHKMVVANTPQTHPDLPGDSKVIFENLEGGAREEDRIHTWEKVQELRSGKYTLWDHTFQLPHQHLEADKIIMDSVSVGSVTHKLKVADNDKLEIYDYPGAYAQRFDGVDKSGGDQPAALQKIFKDNARTVGLRMQQEALPSLLIRGTSTCGQFISGYKFTLDRHFNADGPYVLTSVEHDGKVTNYRSDGSEFSYDNKFTCIPFALPYRPQRNSPRPFIQGTQTAVVVGPAGEEIYCDKYGRIKAQFHWDRQGKRDENSSCWIRVSTTWAGKGWGFLQIPRIGQEVLVDFLEGDPDRPIVIGSVYNAATMPSGKLPDERATSGMKSATYPGSKGFNQVFITDTKDKEMITIHAQKDMTTTIEHDDTLHVKNDRMIVVDDKHTETIKNDTQITITDGNLTHNVATGTAKYHVQADLTEVYSANQKTTVNKNIQIMSETAYIHIQAATEIQLLVGASSLLMKSDGSIKLKGVNIGIDGSSQVNIHGGQVLSSADNAHNISGGSVVSEAQGTNTVKGATVLLNP
jgi:type VI secretion system secreted protein VgrG